MTGERAGGKAEHADRIVESAGDFEIEIENKKEVQFEAQLQLQLQCGVTGEIETEESDRKLECLEHNTLVVGTTRVLNIAQELAGCAEVVHLEVCEEHAHTFVFRDVVLVTVEGLVSDGGEACFGVGERLEVGGRERVRRCELGDGHGIVGGSDELGNNVVGVEGTECVDAGLGHNHRGEGHIGLGGEVERRHHAVAFSSKGELALVECQLAGVDDRLAGLARHGFVGWARCRAR